MSEPLISHPNIVWLRMMLWGIEMYTMRVWDGWISITKFRKNKPARFWQFLLRQSVLSIRLLCEGGAALPLVAIRPVRPAEPVLFHETNPSFGFIYVYSASSRCIRSTPFRNEHRQSFIQSGFDLAPQTLAMCTGIEMTGVHDIFERKIVNIVCLLSKAPILWFNFMGMISVFWCFPVYHYSVSIVGALTRCSSTVEHPNRLGNPRSTRGTLI